MLDSRYVTLGSVALPKFQGRQHYMHGFDIAAPKMRDGFEDFLPVVARLLAMAGATSGTAFMTVDEKTLQPGQTQRRPHPHVDGCFVPEQNKWSHDGYWNHYCNHVPIARMPIIVASNVAACKVWRGKFDGAPKNDGDLSHIAHLLGDGEIVPHNVGALLSPDCVHESLPMTQACERTFLRIALPTSFIGNWQ